MREWFYVTVIDARRIGFLMGPYDNHAKALANVEQAKAAALAVDSSGRAWFYAYGTAKYTGDNPPISVFGY